MFTIRVFHSNVIFMLGPEANHFMTVSHAANFSWRRGFMGDLIPLLGDGLLTIDGDFHRQSRKIMLPAFHRERIEAAHAIMTAETRQALDRVSAGTPFDLYRFTRELALRIAMRALFGLDPDRARAGGINAAHEFEQALGFWARDYLHQILRGPGSPWRRMVAARRRLDALIFAEIDRRRASAEGGEDILTLLLEATDEDGAQLSKRHIRDEVMTLMFAGHDTTTSTVAFLFHELARNPELADDPSFDLGLAIDETLRLYPPAWIGPRRSIAPFAFGGRRLPGGRAGQLLLVGQPPPARRVARARRLPTRALRPGQPRADRQGRLRPVRRRLAHVHRDALRPGRGGRHRRGDPRALPARARARLSARDAARCRPSAPSDGMPMVPRAAKGGPVVAEPALAA